MENILDKMGLLELTTTSSRKFLFSSKDTPQHNIKDCIIVFVFFCL